VTKLLLLLLLLTAIYFSPVAVVLTLVQTKQIRYKTYINEKIQNQNIVPTVPYAVNMSTHIITRTHILHITQKTHTKQNTSIHTPTHYKPIQISTVQDTHQILHYSACLGSMLPEREADYSS
jgi:hypothetical protein